MQDAETTYEIIEGVRRTKAALLFGKAAVSAIVKNLDGVAEIERRDIPLAALRSPFKDAISLITNSDWNRWNSILAAIQSGEVLPPIEVRIGSAGVTIDDVELGSDE